MQAASATVQTFEEAEAAYKRGDYATALRGFRPLAEQGDADAQFFLGVMYDNGEGVPKDDAGTAKWYRRAAEQGLAGSRFALALKHVLGMGVPRNHLQAHVRASQAASRMVDEERLAREAVGPLQVRSATRRDWSVRLCRDAAKRRRCGVEIDPAASQLGRSLTDLYVELGLPGLVRAICLSVRIQLRKRNGTPRFGSLRGPRGPRFRSCKREIVSWRPSVAHHLSSARRT